MHWESVETNTPTGTNLIPQLKYIPYYHLVSKKTTHRSIKKQRKGFSPLYDMFY